MMPSISYVGCIPTDSNSIDSIIQPLNAPSRLIRSLPSVPSVVRFLFHTSQQVLFTTIEPLSPSLMQLRMRFRACSSTSSLSMSLSCHRNPLPSRLEATTSLLVLDSGMAFCFSRSTRVLGTYLLCCKLPREDTFFLSVLLLGLERLQEESSAAERLLSESEFMQWMEVDRTAKSQAAHLQYCPIPKFQISEKAAMSRRRQHQERAIDNIKGQTSCVCGATAQAQGVITCRKCSRIFHGQCLKLRAPKELLECPVCFIRCMNPLVAPVQTLFIGVIDGHGSEVIQFKADASKIKKQRLKVEMRSVRLEQCQYPYFYWPDNIQVNLNEQLSFTIYPLQTFSSEKRRKDKAQLLRDIANRNTLTIQENRYPAYSPEDYKISDANHLVAVFVVKFIDLEELQEKIVKQKHPVQETMKLLQKEMCPNRDVLMEQMAVPMICPIGFTCIKTPVRGRLCKHVRCYDLTNMLKLNLQAKSWQCPICKRSCHDMYVDTLLKQIITKAEKQSIKIEAINFRKGGDEYQVIPKAESEDDQEDSIRVIAEPLNNKKIKLQKKPQKRKQKRELQGELEVITVSDDTPEEQEESAYVESESEDQNLVDVKKQEQESLQSLQVITISQSGEEEEEEKQQSEQSPVSVQLPEIQVQESDKEDQSEQSTEKEAIPHYVYYAPAVEMVSDNSIEETSYIEDFGRLKIGSEKHRVAVELEKLKAGLGHSRLKFQRWVTPMERKYALSLFENFLIGGQSTEEYP